MSVYDIIFEKNLSMSRKKIQSLHELVKDKTIQIIYDKINSVYLSEYKQKIWNDVEHYYSLGLHYANEREDQKIFYGRIILQENNSIFQMTLNDYCFLTHFIFISALINEIKKRGLTVQNLHQIFNDILKFETQYRVNINAKSNQFFRDYIVDRIEIKNAEPVNPASTFIKEIFDFFSKKLKSETDVSLKNILQTHINGELEVNYH